MLRYKVLNIPKIIKDAGNIVPSNMSSQMQTSNHTMVVVPIHCFRGTEYICHKSGFAGQLAEVYPVFNKEVTRQVDLFGKNLNLIKLTALISLCTMPVKPAYAVYTGDNCISAVRDKFVVGEYMPGWACKVTEEVLTNCFRQLKAKVMVQSDTWDVMIPRNMCLEEEVPWHVVKRIIVSELDEMIVSGGVTIFAEDKKYLE